MDKKTLFLAVLSTVSIIIAGDIGTRLYHTEIALQIAEQRIEVLEAQAIDLYKAAEKTTEKGEN